MAITKSEKRRKIANSPSAVTPKRRGIDTASPLANRLAGSPAGSPSSPITPRAKSIPLPPHLARIVTTHTAIESTLSMSLATSSRAPSQVTGLLPAITNTVALESAGLRVRCGVEELRRLCWLWEWDGCTLPQSAGEDRKPTVRSVGPVEDSSEDNPFLDSNTPRKPAPAPAPAPPPTDWVRGGMGLIITPTTQLQRAEGRRVPAYGIGIKVEVTSDESVGVALSAVAKWTADSHLRRKELTDKLQQWVKLHEVSQVTPKANGKTKRLRSLSPVPIPATPFADLPPLSSIPITSTPSTQRILHTPSKGMFSTPSRGAISTPTFARRQGGFATPSSSSRSIFATPSHRKGGIFATPTSVHRSGADTPSNKRLFDGVPMTPTSRAAGVPLPPTPAATPSSYPSSASESGDSRPCTPCTNRVLFKAVHNNLDPQTPRKDKDATPTVPMTPRQAAMAERLRQRALATPSGKTTTVTLGYDAETDTVRTAEATPAELRRRCLLARLPDAAETLLAMFASRRIIPLREAGRSIVSASRCTTQEAEDEMRMLAEMCPKFLRIRVVERDEWVERGTGVTTGKAAKLASPGGSKSSAQIVSSPARKGASSPGAKVPSTPARTGSRSTGASKLAAASPSGASPASATPRKAKEVEVFGLREIRELVRRELEGGI